MKKFLTAILVICSIAFCLPASAQYVTRAKKDSAVGAVTKYINFLNVKKASGFQLTIVKDSGTVGGTVILERRIDTMPGSETSVWKQVGTQSYTITNTAGPQGDIFPISVPDGLSYRFKVTSTGGRIILYGSYIRW